MQELFEKLGRPLPEGFPGNPYDPEQAQQLRRRRKASLTSNRRQLAQVVQGEL